MAEVLLNFVHISDTHLLHPDERKDFADINPELAHYAQQVLAQPHHTTTLSTALVQQINALPVSIDFVLHTGDVAGEATTDYEHIAGLLGQIRYPVLYTPGNHDSLAGFQQWLCPQRAPAVCEYEFNGVQIIALDSSRFGIEHGGRLSADQLKRLDVLCSADDDRPLIVAMHHHPLPIAVPWLDELGLTNGADLHQILLQAGQRLRGVFIGHIHHSLDIYKDGILYSSVASAAYQFTVWPQQQQASLEMLADPGFNLVTVSKDQTVIRHQRFRI